MPDKTTIPSFQSVAPDTLPEATRSSSPESIALGKAIIAAMAGGKAAVDPTPLADRAAATKRAAVLKRAVAAADKTATVGTRVYADGDKWRIAILSKPAAAATAEAAAEAAAEMAAE